MVGKYLGIDILVKGRNLIKAIEEHKIGIAKILAGLDRALVCCEIHGFI